MILSSDIYNIHNIDIVVRTNDHWLRNITKEGFNYFKRTSFSSKKLIIIDLLSSDYYEDFFLKTERILSISKGKITHKARICFDANQNIELINIGKILDTTIDYNQNKITINIHNINKLKSTYDPLYTSSLIFKSFVLEILPHFGLLPIHASMSSYNNKGVIITGPPRCGKSKLNIKLLNSGFSFISDEVGFVNFGDHSINDRIQLKSFPIRIKSVEQINMDYLILIGNSSNGEYVYEINNNKILNKSANPSIVIRINPDIKGKSYYQMDELEILQALLTYDLFYSQKWAGLEMTVFEYLCSSLQGWEISPEFIEYTPELLLNLLLNVKND